LKYKKRIPRFRSIYAKRAIKELLHFVEKLMKDTIIRKDEILGWEIFPLYKRRPKLVATVKKIIK